MNLKEAQFDMRQAYCGGGPGVLASGIVWVISGLIAIFFYKSNQYFGFLLWRNDDSSSRNHAVKVM